MSDPVTNLEIEDVLSSIRRLVAEGDKLRTPAQAATPKPDDAPETLVLTESETAQETIESEPEFEPQAEKFVLSPAFRVDETSSSTVVVWDDDGADESADELASEDVAEAVSAPSDQTVQDESRDDAIAAEDSLDASPADDHLAFQAAPRVSTEHIESDDAAVENTSEVEEEVQSGAVEGRSRLEMTIAELEAAITGKAEDWEPDGSETTPVMDWSSTVAEPAFLSSRHGAKSTEIEDAQEVPETKPFVLRVSAREEIEPEENTDELAADLERSEPAALEGELDETLTAYLEEDEILDEETLRNLVVEIVRQELQGTLGERITRNVRKLVRREIYRVLSSQEFD
ncbi:hypothetical protein [Flavimaricola marinus]|uniref:Uncharacterized protein n=1 Tax=Flavimaricola marinus TaxID=1819565 RepID=A0A238LGY3_9RHOB|nr:hypothetical protein [Flavimaricola marinus]SMY08959.1 hypothetical protein LOM8899_03119 [Flavimaricola marinus]